MCIYIGFIILIYGYMRDKFFPECLLIIITLWFHHQNIASQSNQDVVSTFRVYKNEVICLLVECAFKIILPTTEKGKYLTYYVNKTTENNVKHDGDCSRENASFNLRWEQNAKTTWKMEMDLHAHDHEYTLDTITVNYLRGNDNVTAKSTSKLFTIPLRHFYNCNEEQQVNLKTDNDHQAAVRIIFTNLTLEAFRHSYKTQYIGSESECELDTSRRDAIIAVVIISLIAISVLLIVSLSVGLDMIRGR
uniref:Lysosome-associated membrane glycoprotein 5 n=1 Tax=Trichobilharzia regenti TaxID=157069 RepID=A0AA85JG28_TRIRE|nr:unnamed protein product [Trichobilharzia regenti]